jgi:MFS-type transporter involved in bile tolerance (Atg22 family)
LFLVAQQNEGDDHKFDFLPGIRLAGSSYYTTLTPILVALQALTILLLGTVGDFGNGRKKTLIISAVIGSVAGSLLIAVYNETYWLGGVLVIISNVGLGLSVVMYNAYLPILVRNLPELRGKEDQQDFPELEQVAMNRVSSRGFILGYIAGVILLAINVGVALVSSRIVGGGSCNKWCVHCPTVEGNSSLPGWNSYNYKIFNQTMIREKKFCDDDLLACKAWPGVNPPCGAGILDVDIVNETCVNTQFWDRYTYSPDGVRWSLNTSIANVTFEAEKADNLTDICTRPFAVRTLDLSVPFPANETATNETIGLWAENGNGGCPFFHCSRALCSRNYDPHKCDPHHWGTRINVASGAVWWMLFAIFTYVWLKPRPAPPLPPGTTYVGQSLKRTYAAMKKIKRLRNTFLFLLSFWFSSDGYGTITVGSTIIAAQAPLFFGGLELGILLLEVNLVALFGSIFYEKLSNYIVKRWRDKRIAMGDDPETLDNFWIFRTMKFVNLAFLSLLPIWALPGVGLNTKTQFFIAAGIYGFQIGAIQSNSRMLMSHFTPVGCEAEFFSFFELTDKGTAWCGPLVLTIANEQLNEMRWAVGIITFFFVISAIFLYFVDVKQGYIEALNFHMTAEVELVEAKLKDPSIRVEEEDLSPEELEKRAIETRAIIAKVSKQDLDQPGVLTSRQDQDRLAQGRRRHCRAASRSEQRARRPLHAARVGTDAARRGGAGGVGRRARGGAGGVGRRARGGGGGGVRRGARARRATATHQEEEQDESRSGWHWHRHQEEKEEEQAGPQCARR